MTQFKVAFTNKFLFSGFTIFSASCVKSYLIKNYIHYLKYFIQKNLKIKIELGKLYLSKDKKYFFIKRYV